MYRARNSKNKYNCKLLFEYKEGTECIVFDTETTGIDSYNDQIVEITALKFRVVNKALALKEMIHLYIQPDEPMNEKVVSIHHITNDFLADKPCETEVVDEIATFFGEKAILVGHNVLFDINMLQELYARQGRRFSFLTHLDTLEMARDLIDEKEIKTFLKAEGLTREELAKEKPYRLMNLCWLFGITGTFHTATDDAWATSKLLETFYHEYCKQEEQKDKEKAYINYMHYWNGYNKDQAGLRVNTEYGDLYYSTVSKAWKSSKVDLTKLDIDDLEERVLDRLQISLKELGSLTEKKWNILKQKRREEGIYI